MQRDELAGHSQDELINLVLAQYEQLVRLQAAIEQLKADHEALKYKFERNKKPPTTSKNSSQPPSRDQKSNQSKQRRKRKHGPPAGHEKHERKLVAQADQVVELRPQHCHACQSDLRQREGQLVRVNQVTELPEASAQVIEVRQYQVSCPHCGHRELADAPAGLEMERRFGARLEATVVYYRQEQHMSYERTQEAMQELYGVHLSQGGIDRIMQRAGQSALARVPAIQAEVARSAVIHCDETSSRVDGDNWWEWVFCTPGAVLHIMRDNRSADTIQGVMGQQVAEVWVSDCLSSQLKAPAQMRQLCLAHQLRNLQALLDGHPHLVWAQEMRALFQYAIQVYHRRHSLSPDVFKQQASQVERICDRLLERSNAPPEAHRLLRRYKKHRQSLFVFLYRTDVEPTNNVAEQALRPSVIHRKVTYGFRSEWGAKVYAALASVIHTAELSGVCAFKSIQALFGAPALPRLTGCE